MTGSLLKAYDLTVVQPAVVRGWRQVTTLDALKTAMSWTMIGAQPGTPPSSAQVKPHFHIDAGAIYEDYEAYKDLARRSLWGSQSGSDYAWLTGDANEFFKSLFRAVGDIAKTALVKPSDLLNRTQLFHLHLLHGPSRKITALFHAFEYPSNVEAINQLPMRLFVLGELSHAAADFKSDDAIKNHHNYVCSMDSFSTTDGTGGQLERRGPGQNEFALLSDELPGTEFASLNWFPNDAKTDGSLHNDHVLVIWNKPSNCEYKTAL